MNQETKQCQNCRKEFIIEPEDFAFYDKIKVPPPTWCPECRLQRRLAWRNERSLHRRKCDLCGKEMISIFHKNTPHVVYCQNCWWSDKWDASQYEKEYDFSKTFFEQFYELLKITPLPALFGFHKTLVNSEYTNQVGHLKNCYLIFNSDYDENCYYGSEIESSKDCFDNMMINKCELSFGNVNCEKCYQAVYSIDCEGCQNIWFSKNLTNCSDCFGCINLRHKQYHIFNKPFSKGEYLKKIQNLDLGSFENMMNSLKETQGFLSQSLFKYIHGRLNNNVSGDYISHSNNVFNSYIVKEAQNCKHCLWLLVKPVKDCWDYTEYGDNAQNVYESLCTGFGVNNVKFNFYSAENLINAEYNGYCFSSQNIFGCVSLRHKQYSILNKQYSENEYRELKEKIIKQMENMPYIDQKGRIYKYGEFFPIETSLFAYSETSAQEYFPLSEAEAKSKGYNWKAPEPRNYQLDYKTEDLPDHIKDVDDSIVNKVIQCQHQGKCNEQCTEAFKIIQPELDFYRKMNLPLPRLCPNCRHYQRIEQRNPLKLWKRKCQCAGSQSENGIYKNTIQHQHGDSPCPNEFETSYSPDRLEIVYCEKCYQAEVV